MYARVTLTHIQADKEDEAIQLYINFVVPAAKQQQGFKGLLQILDRDSGNGISITLWETIADLLASETNNYYQEQLNKFSHLLVERPHRNIYEVTVQE